MATTTIRPYSNIYSSYSGNSKNNWEKAWDNDSSTTVTYLGGTGTGYREWAFVLNWSSIPNNAVLKKIRVRINMRNVNDSGTIQFSFGTATSIEYNSSGTRTTVTERTSVNNPYSNTYYELTMPWYALSQTEADAITQGTYKIMYYRANKGQNVINEIYVDVEYEESSKIYPGGNQSTAVYVGSTQASAYLGSTKIL